MRYVIVAVLTGGIGFGLGSIRGANSEAETCQDSLRREADKCVAAIHGMPLPDFISDAQMARLEAVGAAR